MGGGDAPAETTSSETPAKEESSKKAVEAVSQSVTSAKEATTTDFSESDKFYSPLVKNIAKEEGVSLSELDAISGTGKDERVTKNDILKYIEDKKAVLPA